MQSVRPITRCGLFLILASSAVFGDSAAPGYTFTILAQTGDMIDGKVLTGVSSPIINDAGTVAFQGRFDGGSGIFTSSKLVAQTGDTIGGETLTNIAQIAMNNFGTIAFLGDFAGGTGIFTPSALLVKTGDVIGGKTLVSLHGFEGRIGINDAGTVVFEALFTSFENGYPVLGNGIFTNSALVTEGSDVLTLYNPQINNAGTIVFAGSNGFTSFISTQSEFVGASLVDDYPVINNAGTIAYFCAFENPTPSSYICTTSGNWGTGTTIGGRAVFGVPTSRPALNDAGNLVFPARFATDPRLGFDVTAIVTPTEVLVSNGDTIAGKILAFNFPYPDIAINNSGTIVFSTAFADGTTGIVTATPISTGVAGDVNGDGAADCADLAFLTNILGQTYGQAGFDPRADANGDGVIDIRDLAFVAQHLPDGTSCR